MLQIVLQEEDQQQQAAVRMLIRRLKTQVTTIHIIAVHNEMAVVRIADLHKQRQQRQIVAVLITVLGIGQEEVILQVHHKGVQHLAHQVAVAQVGRRVVVEMAEVVQEAHVSTINKLLTRKNLAISGVFSSNDCLRQNL